MFEEVMDTGPKLSATDADSRTASFSFCFQAAGNQKGHEPHEGGGVLDRWRKIGVAMGLTTDLQIAGFLLDRYEKDRGQPAVHCVCCQAPLPLVCVGCQLHSQQDGSCHSDVTKSRAQKAPQVSSPPPDSDSHISVCDLGDIKTESNFAEQDHVTQTPVMSQNIQPASHDNQRPMTGESEGKSNLANWPFPLEPDSDLDLQNIQVSFGDISGLDGEECGTNKEMHIIANFSTGQPQYCAAQSAGRSNQLQSSPVICKSEPDGLIKEQMTVTDRQGKSTSSTHSALTRKSPRHQNITADTAAVGTSATTDVENEHTCRSSNKSRRQSKVKRAERGSEDKRTAIAGKKNETTAAGKKLYVCKDCGASFNWQIVLTRHMRTHTGEKPFMCKQCGATFSWKGALTVHTRIHTGERPFMCEECGYAFRDRGDLKKHVRIHTGERPFVCKDCGFAFYQCGALKKHILRKHTVTVDKSFICDVCGSAFSEIGKLKAHRLRHSGYRPFLCKDCGFAFTHASHLKRHVQAKHLGEKPYVCGQCGAAFTQNSALKMHTVTHTRIKPFLCEKCGMSFTQRSHWIQHSKQQACSRTYACDDCGHTFSLKKNLLKHMRTHRTQDGPFECSECGAAFGNKGCLKQHMQTHRGSGRFMCQECSAVFIQSRSLKKHMRVNHAMVEKHNGSSVSADHIVVTADTSKIAAALSADKPFVCTDCGAAFAQSRYLKRHEKRKHTLEKKFVCVECKAGFIGKSPLIAHMRIHNGDQPFSCQQCGVTFTHYGQLKRHMKRMHETPSEQGVQQSFIDI